MALVAVETEQRAEVGWIKIKQSRIQLKQASARKTIPKFILPSRSDWKRFATTVRCG
jgi:hypothetical protein